jgi:hypothetical protein
LREERVILTMTLLIFDPVVQRFPLSGGLLLLCVFWTRPRHCFVFVLD